MTDNDQILLESFFKQAAQQQIEDNGFTERVMAAVDRSPKSNTLWWSKLWTIFCVAVGVALFFLLGGWESLKMSLGVLSSTIVTSLEVFVTTAPTADLHLNPMLVLLLLAFVVVYLPYQTGRKLSSVL